MLGGVRDRAKTVIVVSASGIVASLLVSMFGFAASSAVGTESTLGMLISLASLVGTLGVLGFTLNLALRALGIKIDWGRVFRRIGFFLGFLKEKLRQALHHLKNSVKTAYKTIR